jgi:hypothetical protein
MLPLFVTSNKCTRGHGSEEFGRRVRGLEARQNQLPGQLLYAPNLQYKQALRRFPMCKTGGAFVPRRFAPVQPTRS